MNYGTSWKELEDRDRLDVVKQFSALVGIIILTVIIVNL